MNLLDIQKEAHSNALAHGWWEGSRCIPEVLALIHSEVSEALEEYRNGHNLGTIYFRATDNKPEGFPTELADAIIRIADLAEWIGIDLGAVVAQKMAFNRTRPFKHGGKLA